MKSRHRTQLLGGHLRDLCMSKYVNDLVILKAGQDQQKTQVITLIKSFPITDATQSRAILR
jgi:hypothetical protein